MIDSLDGASVKVQKSVQMIPFSRVSPRTEMEPGKRGISAGE